MERTKSIKKTNESNGQKKKGLTYVSVNSEETKKTIIDRINANAKTASETGSTIGLIPLSPTPNVSFWINTEEGRSGMTITRENGKWGWNLESEKCNPCKYMAGTGYDELEFDDETTKLIYVKFIDCCGQKLKK